MTFIEDYVLDSTDNWRTEAYEQFQKLGLPHRKQDFWRYTPLHQMYSTKFQKPSKTAHFNRGHFSLDAYVIECTGKEVRIPNHPLPKGVEVLSIIDALQQFPERVLHYLNRMLSSQHAFQALNTAFFESGLWIYVPSHVQLNQPIFIHHQAHAKEMAQIRHVIVCESHSRLNLIEYFDGAQEGSAFINQISEVFLETHALCEHIKIQNMSLTSQLQSEVRVHQSNNSKWNSFLLQKGGVISSCDSQVFLTEPFAKANLSGVFFGKHKQFLQQRLNIHHLVPNCLSSQNFRGILDEHAKGVFIGQVDVSKDAIKTEAHQSNKNLLLSKHAEMITCPQLQIYADDVICSHGATVGQLDLDALFYLQARGLAKDYASQLLVHAFVQEPFDSIHNGHLKAWCLSQLEA